LSNDMASCDYQTVVTLHGRNRNSMEVRIARSSELSTRLIVHRLARQKNIATMAQNSCDCIMDAEIVAYHRIFNGWG
jgi:hypothetical protein